MNTDGNYVLMPLRGVDQQASFEQLAQIYTTVSRLGDTKIVTSESKYYGSCAYFDGSGDGIVLSQTSRFNLYDYDFTIEFWVKFIAIPAAGNCVGLFTHRNSSTSNISFNIWYCRTEGLYCSYSSNGSSQINALNMSTWVPNTGQWYHIAAVRKGPNLDLFVDGSKQTTHNIGTTVLYNSGADIRIGFANSTPTYFLNGYMQDVRATRGLARYTENFTPPGPLCEDADPTVLLMPMRGPNNGVRFLDYSQYPKEIAVVGNTKKVTSQFKYYDSSAYFDGSGDALLVPMRLPTGDFTFECWARCTDISKLFVMLDARSSDNDANGIVIFFNSDFKLRLGGGNPYAATNGFTTLVNNTWYHCALVRQGNVLYAYLNGILEITYAWTAQLTRNVLTLGAHFQYPSGWGPGYLQDVRISNYARYTANFTPPGALVPLDVPRQTLVVPMKGAPNSTVFTDISSNPKAITAKGNAKISSNQFKYYGSSGSFDGTNSYLMIPHSRDLSLIECDFTIECWVYFNNLTGNKTLVNKDGIYAQSYPQYQIYTSGTSLTVGLGNGNGTNPTAQYVIATAPLTTAAWTHIAVTKQGSIVRVFINGVKSAEATLTYQMVEGDKALYVCNDPLTTTNFLNCYLQDLRITKFAALYTADFVPPLRFGSSPQILGTITDQNGNPIQRTILAFDRTNPLRFITAQSDPVTGEYVIDTDTENEHCRIVYGSDDPLYNDIIDRIIPQNPSA